MAHLQPRSSVVVVIVASNQVIHHLFAIKQSSKHASYLSECFSALPSWTPISRDRRPPISLMTWHYQFSLPSIFLVLVHLDQHYVISETQALRNVQFLLNGVVYAVDVLDRNYCVVALTLKKMTTDAIPVCAELPQPMFLFLLKPTFFSTADFNKYRGGLRIKDQSPYLTRITD